MCFQQTCNFSLGLVVPDFYEKMNYVLKSFITSACLMINFYWWKSKSGTIRASMSITTGTVYQMHYQKFLDFEPMATALNKITVL